jgi:hypothetical protein
MALNRNSMFQEATTRRATRMVIWIPTVGISGDNNWNSLRKRKVTFSAEETLPVGAHYSPVLGADDIYRSAETEYLSDGPQYIAPATNTYNARIGLTKGEHYSLYLSGRNLSSARQPHVIYPTPFVTGGLWQYYNQSFLRLVGLQIQAKF